MQPVGSTQGNARAQVDLPASLMLINTHALVDVVNVVNAEQCACASLSAILCCNARARADIQPAGSTQRNARA